MDKNYSSNQVRVDGLSKKQICEIVESRLAHSLDEFHLTGRKFESRLKKASKVFAAIIAKENRKAKKAKK